MIKIFYKIFYKKLMTTKVYILCKENDDYNTIDHIIKVFSNETEALRELYKKSSYEHRYNDTNLGFYDTYVIYTKEIDIEESKSQIEKVYVFKENFITREIWDRVIEELPDKTLLNKLIKYDTEMIEYRKVEKKIAKEIIENKYYSRFSIKEQLSEKMKDIPVPELNFF